MYKAEPMDFEPVISRYSDSLTWQTINASIKVFYTEVMIQSRAVITENQRMLLPSSCKVELSNFADF